MSNNATVKEHPLAHILRAIADGVPVQGKWVTDLDWWDFDPHIHAFIITDKISWRIKPKPKVKMWKFVFARRTEPGVLKVSVSHYPSKEAFDEENSSYVAIQGIDSTMIEVEVD